MWSAQAVHDLKIDHTAIYLPCVEPGAHNSAVGWHGLEHAHVHTHTHACMYIYTHARTYTHTHVRRKAGI